MTTLRSKRLDLPDDAYSLYEHFCEKGWTDGLPIISPTQELVEAMLSSTSRDPQEVIAWMPPTYGAATVEKVAINAVMAGCKPDYFPIVLKAMEVLADPIFYQTPMGTIPTFPLLVVNGPIRDRVGLNYGYSCLGGGTRANLTIGRALRLIQTNIGQGGYLNIRDQTTIGTPGRVGMAFAENEEANPWEPLHVERGFPREASTITVFNAVSILNIVDSWSRSPESLAKNIGGSLAIPGINNYLEPAEPLLVLGVEHASIFAAAGMSKKQVRDLLWQKAYLEFGDLREQGRVHITDSPDQLTIVVAGGYGPHSTFISSFGRHPSVTRVLENL
ncbi:MAG: hypothetical protein HYU29_09365 [Chloroflexi bacterium]|nr:hypothetical protein [Chloroflexota bacterium]